LLRPSCRDTALFVLLRLPPFFSQVRSLVKKRFMIPGGGVAETELAVKLTEWAKTQEGMKGYCVRAFAEALEVGSHDC